METTISMASFIREHRIRMLSELTDENPHMDGMPDGSTHWKCTLKCHGRQMTTYFSQGPAICKEPSADDLLDCLSMDASGIKNARSFEDWCGEYGYDTDSRKAERIYKTCEAQTLKLQKFLGDFAFDQLLWHTERL